MMKKNYLIYLSIVAIVNVITAGTSSSGHNNFISSATSQQIESVNSLKIVPPSQAIQINGRNSRTATKVRRIQQGMPYREAHKILIQQGWQQIIPTANGGIPTLVNSRVPECSGTGLGLCRFEFTNEKRELLVVSTISQIEPTILHWFLDPPPKAIQVRGRNSRTATGVALIKQGVPYKEARKILIQQGWQPNIPTSTGEILKLDNNSQVKLIYDRGYDEIKNCSESGLGLCKFEFMNYKGELLVVSTTSLPKLKVFHWLIEKSAE